LTKKEDIIDINVGGKHFTTSRSTLCSIKGSLLEAMFSGRWDIQKDKKGRYFIDRDPTYFEKILNYLREQRDFDIEDGELSALKAEVNYYGLYDVFFPSSEVVNFELNNWSLELDTNNCGPDLLFSNNNQTVVKTKNDGVWSMVMTKQPIPSSGKIYWEVTTTHNYVTFGITSSLLKDGTKSWGVDENSYGYNPRCQYKVHAGFSNTYGLQLLDRSVYTIGVLVDMDSGTLTFYQNGHNLGKAFEKLQSKNFHPFVSVPAITSKITFTHNGKLPQ